MDDPSLFLVIANIDVSASKLNNALVKIQDCIDKWKMSDRTESFPYKDALVITGIIQWLCQENLYIIPGIRFRTFAS